MRRQRAHSSTPIAPPTTPPNQTSPAREDVAEQVVGDGVVVLDDVVDSGADDSPDQGSEDHLVRPVDGLAELLQATGDQQARRDEPEEREHDPERLQGEADLELCCIRAGPYGPTSRARIRDLVVAETAVAQPLFDRELRDRDHDVAAARPLRGEQRREVGVGLDAALRVDGSDALVAEPVVRGDRLGCDAGEREEQQRDQAGAVATADAVEEHAAGLRVAIAAAARSSQWSQNSRSSTPSSGRCKVVSPSGRWTRSGGLVLVAQVDDRADAMRLERRPAGGGELVGRVGAHHRTPERLAAVGCPQATEVAGVVTALPFEVSSVGHSPDGIRTRSSALKGPRADLHHGAG